MAGVPARAVARWSGVSFAPLPVGVEEGDRDRSSAPPVSRPVPSRAPASHHPVWMGHGGGEPDQPGEQTGGHGDVGWVRPRWPCGAAPTLSRWPLRRAGPARSPASEAPRCGPSSSAGLDQHRRGTPSGSPPPTRVARRRRDVSGTVAASALGEGRVCVEQFRHDFGGRSSAVGAQRSDHLGAVVQPVGFSDRWLSDSVMVLRWTPPGCRPASLVRACSAGSRCCHCSPCSAP
jgi:hypothetical protein